MEISGHRTTARCPFRVCERLHAPGVTLSDALEQREIATYHLRDHEPAKFAVELSFAVRLLRGPPVVKIRNEGVAGK